MIAACDRPNAIELCVQAGLNNKLLEIERRREIDIQLDALEGNYDDPRLQKSLAEENKRFEVMKDKNSAEYREFLHEHEYQIRKDCMKARYQ
jgi:hypothetical protein